MRARVRVRVRVGVRVRVRARARVRVVHLLHQVCELHDGLVVERLDFGLDG